MTEQNDDKQRFAPGQDIQLRGVVKMVNRNGMTIMAPTGTLLYLSESIVGQLEPLAPEQPPEPTHPHLYDGADGVCGHYCIGRWNAEGQYNEFWVEDRNRWASAGTVYVGKERAEAKLSQLTPVEKYDREWLEAAPEHPPQEQGVAGDDNAPPVDESIIAGFKVEILPSGGLQRMYISQGYEIIRLTLEQARSLATEIERRLGK